MLSTKINMYFQRIGKENAFGATCCLSSGSVSDIQQMALTDIKKVKFIFIFTFPGIKNKANELISFRVKI